MVKSCVKKLTGSPDWLHKSEQPIRSQISKLTQLLTMTTTQKFPPLVLVEQTLHELLEDGPDGGEVAAAADPQHRLRLPDVDVRLPGRKWYISGRLAL